MKRGYNELVGLRATFSKVVESYRLTHQYRWWHAGELYQEGSMRTFEMERHAPIVVICEALMETYAPVIRSIWKQDNSRFTSMFLQFDVGVTPASLGLEGEWMHWAEL